MNRKYWPFVTCTSRIWAVSRLVLGERGRPVRYLDVGFARVNAPNPARASLMVVLGGPISATDDALYPTLVPLLSLIEKRIAAGLPTLGICLGAQLIARALGARVYPAAAAKSAGRRLRLTDAGRASPLRHLDGAQTSMMHWHGDTFDLPDHATPPCVDASLREPGVCMGQACAGVAMSSGDSQRPLRALADRQRGRACGAGHRRTPACARRPRSWVRLWKPPRAGCLANGWIRSR